MRIKTIVKVMNFHALLHIDAARRMTEKYIRMESEVQKIIDIIVNNRNFILDKIALNPSESAPPLNIYIGSDYSFCGGLNKQVLNAMLQDDDAEKITVGRKMRVSKLPGLKLAMTKEEFDENYHEVEDLLEASVQRLRHSSINVIYNHYYNAGRIALRRRKVFPIPVAADPEGYTEDFVVEGDVDSLLRRLTSTYASYEVKIASINSFAAENIMRREATTESLKKIDEIEEEELRVQRKKDRLAAFAKAQDGYVKQIAYRGVEL
ncbi:MAG: F0F1 ATP synthase subunit gamma [Coriobacteriales bacterium]|jgi:F0F1-type ATP synthase gamma subunit|nr:F0F1 ATP synthase subunit gamma [Coriobacteriales bacterium]